MPRRARRTQRAPWPRRGPAAHGGGREARGRSGATAIRSAFAFRRGGVDGVIGMSLPIESIKIESGIEGVGVEYSTHIPNVGWQDYVADGEESKVTDSPKRIEAIRVRLTGKNADDYDVYYRVHCQGFGWLGWAKNDEKAGSQGYSYRIEALQIVVVKAGSEAPGSTEGAFKLKPTDIVYTAYVNGDGWQVCSRNGNV